MNGNPFRPERGGPAHRYTVGRWVPLEPGDGFTCPHCQKQVEQRTGPRGGKTWVWKLPDGTRCCSKGCAALTEEQDRIAEMDDDMAMDRWLQERGI